MSSPRYLTRHFALEEFLPAGQRETTPGVEVMENLTRLCIDILEPLRAGLGLPVIVTSGYRPPAYNAAIPFSSRTSDHMTGRAADIRLPASHQRTWEENTRRAFDWIRVHLDGRYGQIIWEDHRIARKSSTQLWIHVATTSPKHPGGDTDANRLLASYEPGKYEKWVESVA